MPKSEVATLPGWGASDAGAAVISDKIAQSGAQSLEIPPSEAERAARYAFAAPADGIVFLDFYILPVADGSKSPVYTVDANGARLGFIKRGDQGTVVAVAENAESKTNAVEAKFTFPVNEEDNAQDWVRVTIRQDLTAKKWDLYLDGELVLIDQPAADGSATGKGAIFSVFASPWRSTFLDGLSISGTNPLFPDADKDGIPDAVEHANGMNLQMNDRNLDLNADGKSNIANFLANEAIREVPQSAKKFLFVDAKSGNDLNSGTASYSLSRGRGPFKTLVAAVRATGNTTTIIVTGGTYQWSNEAANAKDCAINISALEAVNITDRQITTQPL